MADPRARELGRLLVEYCVDVQPGWQVLVAGTAPARPMLEEIARAIGERGAYPLMRVGFDDFGAFLGGIPWILAAPEEALRKLPEIERHAAENVDALIQVVAPENTRAMSAVPPDRLALVQQAAEPIRDRVLGGAVAWVGCHFPTPALAQDAGMSLASFEDFVYDACLIDWDAEGRRMQAIADRLDAASEIRIVGPETDVTLSLEGRNGRIDQGHRNMPGGEVFYCPIEDSAQGTIAFTEFPALYAGRELNGITVRFEDGRVVEASAQSEDAFLQEVLDTDDGARRLGEIGFGCNPGIQQYMKNAAFDEKIDGTVHLALGNSFTDIGGKNESLIHWDIVKDLREDGRIEADGEVVQENGVWKL
jgi:aminopeptidase